MGSTALRKKEPPGRGLQRVCIGLAVNATGHLSCLPGPPSSEDIHECRKSIKRLRALIRIGRHIAPHKSLNAAERNARRAARTLAILRDTDVMANTLLRLKDRGCNTMLDDQFALALEGLQLQGLQQVRAAGRKARPFLQRLAGATGLAPAGPVRSSTSLVSRKAARYLKVCPGHLRAAAVSKITHDDIVKRVRRDYRKLRRDIASIIGNGLPATSALHQDDLAETLHSYRKRIKRLIYATEFLRGAKSKRLRTFCTQLSTFEEQLGFHHDITVLQHVLVNITGTYIGRDGADLLEAKVRSRRHNIERALVKEAPLAFHLKPARLGKLLRTGR